MPFYRIADFTVEFQNRYPRLERQCAAYRLPDGTGNATPDFCISVSEEEIEAEYGKMAEQYGMKAEELKKYITADSVKGQLTNQKVVKIVVDSAKATKVEEKSAKKSEDEEDTAGESAAESGSEE